MKQFLGHIQLNRLKCLFWDFFCFKSLKEIKFQKEGFIFYKKKTVGEVQKDKTT